MIKMTWYKKQIKGLQDVQDFINTFKEAQSEYGSFDTETDGLHIIKNHPFLLIFGFANREQTKGYVYCLDLENVNTLLRRITLDHFIQKFNELTKVVAWNAKFDLHMMSNFGRPYLFQHNITDAQIYARLGHDAIPEKFGGVPMKLKSYAVKYIDNSARIYERRLAQEKKTLKVNRNRKLQELLSERTGKKWAMYTIEEMLKDKVLGIENVPKDIRPIVQEWLDTTPDPDNYRNLNREMVIDYAYMDVIYTLESFLQLLPVVVDRQQQIALKREEELIYPLYEMERVGFSFNRKYAQESKNKLKNYILKMREQLKILANADITVGQHKKIKEILNDDYDLDLESTGSKVLANANITNSDAKDFIKVIGDLRTLEKWYSTYIIKWMSEEVNGRVYTTIHQTGAVSGRVTSDFQQFPQGGVYDDDNNLLFHPRQLIQVTGNEYPVIAYIDYSQIELRFQALYTILVNGGDLNLCRAYMPLKCHERNGKWYLDESPEIEWTPTDLHSLTTKLAFGVDESHPDWKRYRHMGKTTNFACNYGSTVKGLCDELKFDLPTATKLYQAYGKAFPGIWDYRNYVKRILSSYPFIENLFGRKFYGASPHKASNYIVQGSGADLLKDKIIEINKFLKPYKTRFQMNIHDELSFEIHKDELFLILELRNIIENVPGTLVPIVADIEITTTTWDKKVNYEA